MTFPELRRARLRLTGMVMAGLGFFVACGEPEPEKKPTPQPPQADTPLPPDEKPARVAMQPLELALPEPRYESTPESIEEDHEEPIKNRPTLRVPAGVSNVALNKPHVTASVDELIFGELSQANDGNKEGDQYLQLAPGLQYIEIDLEEEYDLYAIALWHDHNRAIVFRDVIVRTALDRQFIKGDTFLFNNDQDNSAGFGIGKDRQYIEGYEGRLIGCDKPVRARYIRFYSNGNNQDEMNYLTEVEVYGKRPK